MCRQRIHSAEASVGHSYNLIDIKTRRILNVETASKNRVSVHEIGATPFFHANMYLHLQVQQVSDMVHQCRRLPPTKANFAFFTISETDHTSMNLDQFNNPKNRVTEPQ